MSSFINTVLTISSIVYRPPANLRIAQFEAAPVLSSTTNFVQSIDSSSQTQGVRAYSLPRNTKLNTIEIFSTGSTPETLQDPLWESLKPASLPGAHIAPCVFPFPGSKAHSKAGTLTVKITIPVLEEESDWGQRVLNDGSYILVGIPDLKIPESQAYRFISEPVKIEQRERPQDIEIETRLETQAKEPFVAGFNGNVVWSLEMLQKEKKHDGADSIKCRVNGQQSPFMEFYILGDNLPSAYADWKNTFGIPIYLLRMLLTDNRVLSLSDYRKQAVEWAFSRAGKVYNRFSAEGTGARYVGSVQFSRSYGFTEQDFEKDGQGAEFSTDHSKRFFVDWYLMESLAAAKRQVTGVSELPRVNCPDQASIVRLALDLSCMQGEQPAKVLTLETKKRHIMIDGLLVGFGQRSNNAFISRVNRDTPIDSNLKVDDNDKNRRGFKQHFCVSMKDPKTRKDLIYDATIAAMNGQGNPIYIDGMERSKYLDVIINTEGAVLSTDEDSKFFPSPRYSFPPLDLTTE